MSNTGIVDILILALLEKRPRHGYEIKKKSREILVSELELNNNLLYPSMRRLSEGGFIRPDWATTPGHSAPSRRVYAIGEEGRARLRELLADFGENEAPRRNEFYVRLAFFDLVGKRERERIVTARAAALGAELRGLEERFAVKSASPSSRWSVEIARRRMEEIKSELAWTESLLERKEGPR